MSEVEVGRAEINKVACILTASNYGDWRVYLDDGDGERGQSMGNGDTLDKAIAQARGAINKRKVKIKVPFRTETGEFGVSTGLHGGTGNVMVDIGGSKSQVGGFGRGSYFDAETPDEVMRKLHDEKNKKADAEREIRQIVDQWGINLSTTIKEAIDAKVAENEAKA